MSVKLGRQIPVGFGKETTRLTALSAATFWAPYTEFDLQKRQEFDDNNSAAGVRESMFDRRVEHEFVEGNIGGFIDTDSVAWLNFFLFGQVSNVQEATSGAYKGTFLSLNNVQLPTATFFYSRPGTVGNLRARGVSVNSLELSVEAKGQATFTAGLIGLEETTDPGTPTPAITAPTRRLQSRHFKLFTATTVAGLGAGTEVILRSASLNMQNNNALDEALGNLNPVDNFGQNFTAELQMSGVLKTAAFETLRNTGTKSAFRLQGEDTAAASLGTSALKPMLRYEIAPSLVEVTYSQSLDEVVMFDATVQATFSVSDAFAIRGYVQNLISTY